MYKSRVVFLLVVLFRSASFQPRNLSYKSEKASYEPSIDIYEGVNAVNELRSLDDSKNESYEPRNVEYDAEKAIYEPNSEVTMFGYHMKIGVPKAIELLKSEGYQSRIVGGSQVASASVNPHQAGIIARLTTGWQSVCGGSLISNTRVLTAAHCWWDGEKQANLFTIVLGSVTIFSGGTRIDTTAVTVHSSWNARDITNDIAMVRISRVNFNNNIRAIPLPARTDVNLNFAGATGTASGFGYTRDTQTAATTNLHQVSVNIITNSDCQRSFQTVTLHSSHLCSSGSGRVGTCDGDSGGPLTTVHKNKRILVGVVSFGLSDGCQSGHPSVYSRVTAFLPWINANM